MVKKDPDPASPPSSRPTSAPPPLPSSGAIAHETGVAGRRNNRRKKQIETLKRKFARRATNSGKADDHKDNE